MLVTTMKKKLATKVFIILLLLSFFKPSVLSQQNSSIGAWEKVNAWVYQLQDFSVQGIATANAELAVIDYSYDGTEEQEVPKSDLTAMKFGKHPKAIVSYMSIGEAENYRFYWKDEWETNPPSWLGPENPNWPGNYKVRYWDPEWQRIIFGTSESYLDRIIKAGFDGVYLDIIDAYEFFQNERPSAKEDMVDFVISIAHYARNLTGASFGIFPQNAEELLEDNRYLSAVTGLGREEVYYIATNDPRPASETARIEERLDLLVKNNKLALVVDYATNSDLVIDAYERAQKKAYIPYVTEVGLDTLTPTYNDFLSGMIKANHDKQDSFFGLGGIGLWAVIGATLSGLGVFVLVILQKRK